MKSSWIFLDRDGVINQDSPDYIKCPDEWLPLQGSLEAIAMMNQKGYRVAVATNQSGLARKLYDEATLAQIHLKMNQELATFNANIEHIVYCPHGPDDACLCRKPQPGLLYKLEQVTNAHLKETPFVGDSLRDLKAAMAAGCKPVLVETGNGLKTLKQDEIKRYKIPVYKTLLDFALHL